MINGYTTYRLKLPSGGVVRVRKPGIVGLLGRASSLLPLLTAAIEVARPSDTETTRSTREPHTIMTTLLAVAAATLCAPTLAEDLPFADLMALAQWARSERAEPAVADGESTWHPYDLTPLVQSATAVLLDKVAARYGQRPSLFVGLSETLLAADFDLAIGYRGLRAESGDSGEVEVEDMWGNTVTVPRSALATADVPRGAKIINPDWYVDRYGPNFSIRPGGGELNLTAGGV